MLGRCEIRYSFSGEYVDGEREILWAVYRNRL